MAMLKSNVKCWPGTERIAVTTWRQPSAKADGPWAPAHGYQSPVISQPSRIVDEPSPASTSCWATERNLPLYAPLASVFSDADSLSGSMGTDQTWWAVEPGQYLTSPCAATPVIESQVDVPV